MADKRNSLTRPLYLNGVLAIGGLTMLVYLLLRRATGDTDTGEALSGALIFLAVAAVGVFLFVRWVVGRLIRPLDVAESVVAQVAFEISERGRADLRLVDVGGFQALRGAEIGVHGALAVRRHHDVTARGRRTVARRLGAEGNAGRTDIVREGAAEFVVLHLADEGRARSEARHADDGVGGRAARAFHRRAHRLVDLLRTRLVDQRHGAFVHALSHQKIVLGAGDHVDNGVADADDVVAGGSSHAFTSLQCAAHYSGARHAGNAIASEAAAVFSVLPGSTRENIRRPECRWLSSPIG